MGRGKGSQGLNSEFLRGEGHAGTGPSTVGVTSVSWHRKGNESSRLEEGEKLARWGRGSQRVKNYRPSQGVKKGNWPRGRIVQKKLSKRYRERIFGALITSAGYVETGLLLKLIKKGMATVYDVRKAVGLGRDPKYESLGGSKKKSSGLQGGGCRHHPFWESQDKGPGRPCRERTECEGEGEIANYSACGTGGKVAR